MKIFYISVIELNAGWGAEWFVNDGFIKNGHETITLDYRKYRSQLVEKMAEVTDYDVLFLQRGDGFPVELLKNINKPKFFWASEPLAFQRDQDHLIKSGIFDHVFVHTNLCREKVIKGKWLPENKVSVLLNGFDEKLHRKIESSPKDIDILFIGTITPRRKEILEELGKSFNIAVVRALGEDMVSLFNRSKIILNIHSYGWYLDTETRIFEALGCGSFVITEKLSEENPFISGKHLIEVEDIEEMKEKISYYLLHDQERETITRQGYTEALANHTYNKRAQYMAEIFSNCFDIYTVKRASLSNKEKLIYALVSLENQKQVDENSQLFVQLIAEGVVSEDDIIACVSKHILQKVELLNYLVIILYEKQLFDFIIPLLQYAYKLNNNDVDTIYNLGYFLYKLNLKDLALTYLQKGKKLDDKIDKLIELIEGNNKLSFS